MKVTIKGCKEIKGMIKISGSKNSALPLLALSLLTKQKVKFTNVPMITDIYNMLNLLKEVGVKVKVNYNNNIVILKGRKIKKEFTSDNAKRIRASYYLYPGLIYRHKTVKAIKPGGCNFTNRPINYHLDIFKKSNIEVIEDMNNIYFKRRKTNSFEISFPTPSVGATINAILHSAFIKGKTKIINQPLEPEISEVINCLRLMGSKIDIKDNVIEITGVKRLKGVKYDIMPDRIELGSYLLLASTLKSNVSFLNIKEDSFLYLVPYLNELNINYIYNKEELSINQNNNIKGCNIDVNVYPSFPTDLQPILCAALLNAKDQSYIKDNVYPKRLSHIKEMQKLGGSIYEENGKIVIEKSTLEGSNVYAHDLRCGFALIVCAALAKGSTTIENFEVIFRGYENIIMKLKSIGLQIEEHCLK